jgi:hypothetical protein
MEMETVQVLPWCHIVTLCPCTCIVFPVQTLSWSKVLAGSVRATGVAVIPAGPAQCLWSQTTFLSALKKQHQTGTISNDTQHQVGVSEHTGD